MQAITRDECHYYHIKHGDGEGPRLLVGAGSVAYQVKRGSAKTPGRSVVEGEVHTPGESVKVMASIPRANYKQLYTLFVIGLKVGSEYKISKGNADILLMDDEDEVELPLTGKCQPTNFMSR